MWFWERRDLFFVLLAFQIWIAELHGLPLYALRGSHSPTRPIQNRLLHNFRNTRVSGGNEPVFLLIDLLEMKRFLCAKSKCPWGGSAAWSALRPPGVIVIITASGGEGWSGPRIDFCTDCIVVFGARADDYIAALVLTLQHRWDTWGKKKKVCGLFLLPWLTLLSCPRLLPSPCVTVLSYAWGRLISNRQTQLSAPLIMRLFVLGDDLGHGPDAHALCRMYGTLRCRRKAINVPLSSVIWGGEIKG